MFYEKTIRKQVIPSYFGRPEESVFAVSVHQKKKDA